ncbi:hypothetical protein L0Y49_02165 [bacterium]|nr:hypothetical protein [bacterium]
MENREKGFEKRESPPPYDTPRFLLDEKPHEEELIGGGPLRGKILRKIWRDENGAILHQVIYEYDQATKKPIREIWYDDDGDRPSAEFLIKEITSDDEEAEVWRYVEREREMKEGEKRWTEPVENASFDKGGKLIEGFLKWPNEPYGIRYHPDKKREGWRVHKESGEDGDSFSGGWEPVDP